MLRTAEAVTDATQRKYEKVWEVELNTNDSSNKTIPLPPLESIYDGRQQPEQ